MKAMKERMLAKLGAHHERTMACQETTEARLECREPTSVDMESEAEHREFPQKEAAVKSNGKMRKWYRGRHLDAGLRGEPKELTRGGCGSRKKFAATCRKVSRCARVAQRKRNRKGVTDLGGGRPRHLNKRELKKLRRESSGSVNDTLRKTIGLEIAKRIVKSTVGLRTIKDRTLWRG
jgi:hypothetical protein